MQINDGEIIINFCRKVTGIKLACQLSGLNGWDKIAVMARLNIHAGKRRGGGGGGGEGYYYFN